MTGSKNKLSKGNSKTKSSFFKLKSELTLKNSVTMSYIYISSVMCTAGPEISQEEGFLNENSLTSLCWEVQNSVKPF